MTEKNVQQQAAVEEQPAARIHQIMSGNGSSRFPGVLFFPEEIKDDTPPADAVLVRGIARTFGFHPERLEQSRPEVKSIITEVVQDAFLKEVGGGYSFLALCNDRLGNQWAEHTTMEELCCLAIGLKLAGRRCSLD